MKKITSLILCMLLVLTMFVGCTSGDNTETNATVETEETQQTETENTGDDAAESDSSDALDIAVVAISATESNNARYIQGLQDAAAERGWNVTVLDANGSTDDANAAFSNFISRDADFIIDMVFPATSLSTGLLAAQEANVPVLTWGGGMADGVYFTNGSGGPTATNVIKKMCEDMGGKGEILALTYHDGQVAREREEELDKILGDYPDIVVTKNEVGIPGYYQDGMDYATAWLASRPAGAANYAIWGSWDDPALGAIATLKQMGRDDVKVYGENGNADAIQAIRDGWMTATAWQDGYGEGIAAIKAIEEMYTQGDAFEKGARELEAVLITAENVEAFVAEHPEVIENVQ